MSIPMKDPSAGKEQGPRLFAVPNSLQSYVENGQSLLVTFYNTVSATYTLSGRILNSSQDVILVGRTFTPASTGLAVQYIIPLPNGYINTLCITVSSGTVLYGECFCNIQLLSGLNATSLPLALLGSNYVSSGYPLTVPTSNLAFPTDGRGAYKVINPADPAAGVSFIQVNFPQNTLIEIVSAKVQLTTGVGVAARALNFNFIPNISGNAPSVLSTVSGIIGASSTAFIGTSRNAPEFDYTLSGQRQIGLAMGSAVSLSNVGAGNTPRFQVVVENMQAADQLSNFTVEYIQWTNA